MLGVCKQYTSSYVSQAKIIFSESCSQLAVNLLREVDAALTLIHRWQIIHEYLRTGLLSSPASVRSSQFINIFSRDSNSNFIMCSPDITVPYYYIFCYLFIFQ